MSERLVKGIDPACKARNLPICQRTVIDPNLVQSTREITAILRATHADSDIVLGNEFVGGVAAAEVCVFQAIYVELGVLRP